MKNTPGLKTELKANQRMALMGRLRMADWIEMPEREFAQEIKKIEQDPLFQKLFFGNPERPSVIRRERWPRARLSSGLFEMNEGVLAKGERVQVEKLLEEKQFLIEKIQKMGSEAFERYFIHAEEPLSLQEIARRVKMSEADVKSIHDLLLEMGTQAEFELPDRDPGLIRGYSCLARLSVESGEPSFEFFSPHWARGRYQIRYDLLDQWKDGQTLPAEERRRLPWLLKRLETVNLRQNTMFRILETSSQLQADFLKDKKEESKRPISLRQLARRLDLAPSTVSRALAGRSVALPWGKEVPLISLAPGRRNVVREIMSQWLDEDTHQTDAALAERLKQEHAIRISRRTVNAVRNEVLRRNK